ncbi:MAG TPA: hypothetical protein HPP87_00070 [Planctomycetes bacterium]|nr:hypothetical protein [Planctomycetota bacterium]
MRGKSAYFRMVIVCLAGFWWPTAARADLMAIWDFGPDADGYTTAPTTEYVIGTPVLVLFGGELDANGKEGIDYTDAEGSYHEAGRAGAWNNVTADSEWSVTINTTNWQDMVIRWDYNSEDDPCDYGPESFDFDYRVGGAGGWIRILSNHPITRDSFWHEFSYDLGLLTDIENESIVQFRIRDLNQGTESGGYFKLDNIEVTGTTSASVSLLSPNGGERLIAGCVDVTWENTGLIENLLIEYSPDAGSEWLTIDTAPNIGLYEWKVTDANSTQCLVRLSDKENHNTADTSDSVFTIYQCALAYDLNCDCFIDLKDFVLLVSEWLQCGDPLDSDCIQ